MVWEWVVLGAVVLAALVAVSYYNSIRVLSNQIENAWAQIDVQLKKRNDLVPNLISTVKGYAKHETEAIKTVTEARAKMMGATSTDAKVEAANMMTGALKSILALAENYPQLRANENFLQLQEELSGIENKIAYARQFYNDAVLSYNNLVTTIPGVWFAGVFNSKQHSMLATPESERAVPKVQF